MRSLRCLRDKCRRVGCLGLVEVNSLLADGTAYKARLNSAYDAPLKSTVIARVGR